MIYIVWIESFFTYHYFLPVITPQKITSYSQQIYIL